MATESLDKRRSGDNRTYPDMDSAPDPDAELVQAAANDPTALNDLFARFRDRLKKMVRLRINPQLQSRIDESDIVQEMLIDASRNFEDYVKEPRLPFYLWLRHLTGLKLAEAHRTHLGTQKRDAQQEVSLEDVRPQDASAASMAASIAASGDTPADEAIKQELMQKVQAALEQMDPIDREVLALRHFEQLSVAETAIELGLSKAGAGSRYLRALQRLRDVMGEIEGFDEIEF